MDPDPAMPNVTRLVAGYFPQLLRTANCIPCFGPVFGLVCAVVRLTACHLLMMYDTVASV